MFLTSAWKQQKMVSNMRRGSPVNSSTRDSLNYLEAKFTTNMYKMDMLLEFTLNKFWSCCKIEKELVSLVNRTRPSHANSHLRPFPTLSYILTKKSFFHIHSPLKKFVLPLKSLEIFNFCFTFRWRRERTSGANFVRGFKMGSTGYSLWKRLLSTLIFHRTFGVWVVIISLRSFGFHLFQISVMFIFIRPRIIFRSLHFFLQT